MRDERCHLDLAARLALRGMGHVEPNPMVGAVLVKSDRVIGLGHHRRYGHLHAEREALESARRQGHDPRGSTLYCTLEPCCHRGKQPPCTDAVIAAGIARVIYARPDPNPISRGGADILRAAGIPTELSAISPFATAVSLPFIKNITTDLPFVIAKWAQTADGRLITRPDEPRWITGPVARRRVHALRGRVDAVLTGIGTILADDPRLTPRAVRPRRIPRRIVLDTTLRTPPNAALFADAGKSTVVIVGSESAACSPRADRLRAAGAVIESVPAPEGRLDLVHALRVLKEKHSISSVMIEAGPTLLHALFARDLIDAAVVHAAPDSSAAHEAAETRPVSVVPRTDPLPPLWTRRAGTDRELFSLRRDL